MYSTIEWSDLGRWLSALVITAAVLWLLLLCSLYALRPSQFNLRDAVQLVTPTVRLLRKIATDAEQPWRLRLPLWLLLGYLLCPVDVVPDFLPGVGQIDDVILVVVVLRGVIKRAGTDYLRSQWTGSPEGLKTVLRLCGKD